MFEDLADGDPQLRQLVAAERAAAQAYLTCLDALVALWDSTPEVDRVGRRPHVLAEAGLALGLHPVSVEARLSVAHALQLHPLLRELLADARLGVAHVLVAVHECGALGDDDLAARVLRDVLGAGGPDGRPGWDDTPARLRRALQRAALRLDPDGAARRRQEQLVERTGVRLRPQSDGLAAWVATGAAVQLLAADRLLDVASRPDGPDDRRSRGQRQIDALLGALAARAGGGATLELQLEVPVAVTATRPVRGCAPEPAAVRADLTPELLDLLAGSASARRGHNPPSAARPPLVAVAPGEPPCSPIEPGLEDGSDGQQEGPRLDVAGPRDDQPRDPAPDHLVDGLSRHLQDRPPDDPHDLPPDDPHDIPPDDPHDLPPDDSQRSCVEVQQSQAPHDHRHLDAADQRALSDLGRRAERPVPGLGAGPLDPGALAELLADPDGLPVGLRAVTVRRVCTDPTGQVVAVDAHAVPLARLLAGLPAPPREPQTADEPAAALLVRLLDHLPTPPPATRGYRPTADQTRVVRARDRTCTFPGCSRGARQTDLDHRQPHPDGATSTSNLHPLCRRHHRLKHSGWTCRRHADGTTGWTSPRGQHVRSGP